MKLRYLLLLNIFFLSSLVYSMEFENTQIQETSWNNFSIILDESNYKIFLKNKLLMPTHFIISKAELVDNGKYKIDFSSTQNGITRTQILACFQQINVNLERIEPVFLEKSNKFVLVFQNLNDAVKFINKFDKMKYTGVERKVLIKDEIIYTNIFFTKKMLLKEVFKFFANLSNDIAQIYIVTE